MDFGLSEELIMLLDMVHDFAAVTIVPYADEWDERHYSSYGTSLLVHKNCTLPLGAVASDFSAKFMNLFLKEKINPMIGAVRVSSVPMSARVV